MVYKDVVLKSSFFHLPGEDVIDLTGKYFLPSYAIYPFFQIEWREKAKGSFTQMAMGHLRKRIRDEGGWIRLYNEVGEYQGKSFPTFATYDSKKNEITCYYFEEDDEWMEVEFHTFRGETIEVSFLPFYAYRDGVEMKIHISKGLDLRYMIAQTISLCQKKVLSVSYEH